MQRTYTVQFFGCKTSQSDALSYGGALQRAGWSESAGDISPELVVIQSCTVTMSADAQVRQLVRRVKKEHPDAKILLTGCYAQRAEKELAAMPGVDYVIGNLNPRKWEILSEIAGASTIGSEQSSHADPDFPMPGETTRTRPYIKIQEGCDAHCSYCIIPSVRGKSRSLPVEEVIRRIIHFRDCGYKEMIFTGISMGGYGKDLNPKSSLRELMERVEKVEGNFKIRMSSIEPEEIDQDFVDVYLSGNRFQPHLHIPLQSASDRVLKRMRRQYLFRHFDSIVSKLLEARPQLNIGTDILVGFPAEGREEFEETRRYVENGPFAYCHVFPFSPRPETAAASYQRSASDKEVSERALVMRELSREKNYSYRKRFKGKILSAIRLSGTSEALTENYIRVQLGSCEGEIDSIRINKLDMMNTYATAC